MQRIPVKAAAMLALMEKSQSKAVNLSVSRAEKDMFQVQAAANAFPGRVMEQR